MEAEEEGVCVEGEGEGEVGEGREEEREGMKVREDSVAAHAEVDGHWRRLSELLLSC